MVEKVCIDSDYLISILHNKEYHKSVLQSLDAEIYTTSINIFELEYGKKEGEDIVELISKFNIVDFDKESAQISGRILLSLKKEGQIVDYKDIFIGAICIKNDLRLLTENKKHFERLKKFGLQLV